MVDLIRLTQLVTDCRVSYPLPDRPYFGPRIDIINVSLSISRARSRCSSPFSTFSPQTFPSSAADSYLTFLVYTLSLAFSWSQHCRDAQGNGPRPVPRGFAETKDLDILSSLYRLFVMDGVVITPLVDSKRGRRQVGQVGCRLLCSLTTRCPRRAPVEDACWVRPIWPLPNPRSLVADMIA